MYVLSPLSLVTTMGVYSKGKHPYVHNTTPYTPLLGECHSKKNKHPWGRALRGTFQVTPSSGTAYPTHQHPYCPTRLAQNPKYSTPGNAKKHYMWSHLRPH